MRLPSRIAGVLLGLVGLIWLLQGTDLLQGSPMTGQRFWAAAGIVLLIVAAPLLFVGFRPRRTRPKS